MSRFPSSALYPFLGEGSPAKIDHRKKATLILTSLLEDLGVVLFGEKHGPSASRRMLLHSCLVPAWLGFEGAGSFEAQEFPS